MKAYVIALETVHDETMFGEYRKQVIPTLAAFEGKFVARGGKFTSLEGQWEHARTVIIEFPNREAAEAWYKSPEYQKIIPIRQKSATTRVYMLDGLAQ